MKKQIKTILFYLISLVFLYCIYDSIQHIRAEIYHRNGFIKKERNYPKFANQDFLIATTLMPWENHYRLQLAKSLESTAKKHPKEANLFIKQAIQEYQTLIESDPVNPWFQARLGLIFHELYKRNKNNESAKTLAFNYAQQATKNDPKNPLFTLHFGHLMFSYEKFDKAKEYYHKTLDYDNEMTEAHFNLAAIYNMEKNYEKSINHYESVVEQLETLEQKQKRKPKPDQKLKIETFQNARIKLANNYLNKNQPIDAFKLIEKIPVSVERYELLARYYAKTNQKKTAISLYKQLNERLKTTTYNQQIDALSK